MRIALVQMRSVLGDKDANLGRAEELLEGVAATADLACLPEMFDVGYDLEAVGGALVTLAETVPGPTTGALGELAQRLGLALVAGVVERDPGVPEVLYDTAVLLSKDGTLVGAYRKTHLYPTEHQFFRAGDRLAVFELDGVKLGVVICFEHAFPEIASTLVRRGAELVVNPSAVPVGYGYLQALRCRARAQDNQVYVAAVNHVGEEGGAVYCGSSFVADPRGDVVVVASGTDTDVVATDIDLERIRAERRQEPVFRSRRPELYEP